MPLVQLPPLPDRKVRDREKHFLCTNGAIIYPDDLPSAMG
jgi:hypothetical protein